VKSVKSREIPGNPGKSWNSREILRNQRKSREIAEIREILGNPGKSREIIGNPRKF